MGKAKKAGKLLHIGMDSKYLHMWMRGFFVLRLKQASAPCLADTEGYAAGDCTLSAADGAVLVLQNADGSNLKPWHSGAGGLLISRFNTCSNFQYVRFSAPVNPLQTGDTARLWVWAGLAHGVVLAAVRFVAAHRKRR